MNWNLCAFLWSPWVVSISTSIKFHCPWRTGPTRIIVNIRVWYWVCPGFSMCIVIRILSEGLVPCYRIFIFMIRLTSVLSWKLIVRLLLERLCIELCVLPGVWLVDGAILRDAWCPCWHSNVMSELSESLSSDTSMRIGFLPRWLLTRRGSGMTRALSVCYRQIIIRVWHLVFTLLRRWYDLRANKIIFAIAVMRRGITILCNLCSIDILLHRIAALRLVCDNCGGKLVRRDGLYVIFSRWHH